MKILIIHADRTFRRLLETVFSREGWEVLSVPGIANAMLETIKEPPDLVILDPFAPNLCDSITVETPGSRYTVWLRDRAQLPNVPILALLEREDEHLARAARDWLKISHVFYRPNLNVANLTEYIRRLSHQLTSNRPR